ncbi:MAG: DivIVA domain-containing protein [Clostridia bacterium]|nr:DivIVA domain-containing protein [Clostridia bacterium]
MSSENGQTGFAISFRGYDREEVNRFIEQNDKKYAQAIRSANEENRRLAREYEAKLAEAEKKASELSDRLASAEERLSVVKSVAERERAESETRIAALTERAEGAEARAAALTEEKEKLSARLVELANRVINLEEQLRGTPARTGTPTDRATLMSQLKIILGDLFDGEGNK